MVLNINADVAAAALASEIKAAMVLLLTKKNTMTINSELAHFIDKVDDSTVAQAVRRVAKRIQDDPRLVRGLGDSPKRRSHNVMCQDVTPSALQQASAEELAHPSPFGDSIE